ncbi:putative exported protein [plant metagenome]|uniref:Putative exported protein n=2 Tax=root TaxID=1 RepID=A0A1C3K0X1_9BURK|nr:I78 family peptidase inhibitor [Orrella dioscoreae]SBT25160.1 putative exported protein [Orrella dioscoreae]SOE47459.1 putative exported protein [Orrella dioscoreae]
MFHVRSGLTPVALLVSAGILAGCAGRSDVSRPAAAEPAPSGSAAATTPPPAAGGECNADTVQDALGKTISDSLAATLRERSGSATGRTLRPGQVVTMEYNPQRLNILVDDAGVITAIRCG